MKRLLDTNAYAALKRGHAGAAGSARDAEELFFSIVVVGEILFGFRWPSRIARGARGDAARLPLVGRHLCRALRKRSSNR